MIILYNFDIFVVASDLYYTSMIVIESLKFVVLDCSFLSYNLFTIVINTFTGKRQEMALL